VAVGGLGVGAREVRGVAITPGYLRVTEGGALRGFSVAAFNHVEGRMHGLSIAVVNIAEELHGVQIGLINVAWNKSSWPILPLVNFHR